MENSNPYLSSVYSKDKVKDKRVEIKSENPYLSPEFKKDTTNISVDITSNPYLSPKYSTDMSKISSQSFDQMSNLGKVIDVINRPAYGIKSVMLERQKRNLQAEKGISPYDVMGQMKAKMAVQPTIGENVQAFGRGFTGQEKPTMNEIYKNAGIQGVPGLGFASEIAVDPLTYVSGPIAQGLLKTVIKPGVGKVVQVGTKTLEKLSEKSPMLGEVIGKGEETVKAVGQGIKDIFVNSTGIPVLDKLVKKYTLEKEYLKGKSLDYGIKVRKAIETVVQKTGRTVDDVSNEIVNLIENPKSTVATSQETKLIADLLSSKFNRLLEKEIKAGVSVNQLRGELGYFPRYTSEQVKDYFSKAGKNVGMGSKVWNAKLKESVARKTGDWTLEEVNQFAKEIGMPSLGGKKVEEFFLKNPAYASAMRGVSSAKAVTSAQFLDEVGNTFGQSSKIAPQFWEEAPETLQKMMPSLRGKKFDPEVLSEINRVYTKILNPQETQGFVKMFDAVQNYWKAWTLSIFPKYHLRNVVGNVWNNYLAGVVNPDVYAEAGALQAYRKTGNLRYLNSLKIPKDQADEILLQAEKMGVLGKGFYGGDIPRAIEQAVGKTSKNILSTEGPVIRFGKGTGTTLENNARLAHFVDRLSKGDTAEDAALSVKKFLFDYGDLTPFERDVMKKLFPFYTWTRKNIPLQVENLIKQPQKFIPIEKTLAGRNERDLRRLDLINPSLSERLPVEFARTDKTITYLPLEGLLPASDVSKLFRPQELFAEMLSPYIKTPVEILMNKSFYTEKEINNPYIPNETKEFLRMDIPNKWKYALTSVFPMARMANEINNMVKKKQKGEPLNRNEALFSNLLGSVYKMNLKDLKQRAFGVVDKKLREIDDAYSWAKENKREAEAQRMKVLYKKTMKEIKGIK